MRKLLVVVAIGVVSAAGVALADEDIGCGWGTIMWKGQSGVAPKVLGATTNGIFGNQTFGISSATAGCRGHGVIKADSRASMFAGANIDRLSRDMAAGGGETLDSLAQLMGISETDRPAFFHLTQRNFGAIFPTEGVTAGEMLTTIHQLMATDPGLAKYALS